MNRRHLVYYSVIVQLCVYIQIYFLNDDMSHMELSQLHNCNLTFRIVNDNWDLQLYDQCKYTFLVSYAPIEIN